MYCDQGRLSPTECGIMRRGLLIMLTCSAVFGCPKKDEPSSKNLEMIDRDTDLVTEEDLEDLPEIK